MEKELLQGCWIENERDGDMKREQQISHLKEAAARGEDWIREAVKTRIFDIYQEDPWNLKGDLISTQSAQEFRRLSTNIRQFCKGVGYPAFCVDPLDNVNALYEYLTSRKFWRHELQKSHYEQKRIIVSLSYRHLMERLPLRTEGGETNEGESKDDEPKSEERRSEKLKSQIKSKDEEPPTETKRWEKFWSTAWDNAKTDEKNPLWDIWIRYKKYENRIGNRGKVLYSTLSGNIHTYRNRTIEVDESQWNWDDFEILKALTPSGGPNARYDWAKTKVLVRKP